MIMMRKVKMAKTTTHFKLILNDFTIDRTPNKVKSINGIKAGNNANDSRKSPCNKLNNDL